MRRAIAGVIIDAAARLLAEQGTNNMSIEQIAAAAGAGKGTVFHRFGSRAKLLRALVVEYAVALRLAVTSGGPPLGPGAPARERLLAFFGAFADFAIEHYELYAVYSGVVDSPQSE